MNQLFTIYDNLLNGYVVESLDILSIVTLLFGIAVIINKNPIKKDTASKIQNRFADCVEQRR